MLEELDRVRQELGWPIVMTPFAQMVITQAVMNVTGGERYGVVPDEIIRYALGRFGSLISRELLCSTRSSTRAA